MRGRQGEGAKTCIGNALYMTGGTAVGCDIHHNDGGYTSTSSAASASAVVYISSSGVLLNSKIHENNKAGIPGVYQAGGTMANCLIYGNQGSKYGGGLYKTGGNTYYCTIWGNVMDGDSTGVSGAYVSGGTMQNCILVGNGPVSSTGGSISVSGTSATIQYCVLDKDITGKNIANNTNNSSVLFTSPANGDFTIASMVSPAVGRALPLADYPYDIAGTERDTAAPTAGAYEYVQQTGVFAVDFGFDRPDHGYGEVVSASALLVGATEDEVTFAWYVDGEPIAGATGSVLSFTPAPGRHAVKVVATKNVGGETAEKEYAEALDIRPTVCYVNETGSGTYPYATPETATNSLNEALTTVWTASSEKARILVGAGTYVIGATVALTQPIELVGAGRDMTFVTGYDGRAFSVAHAEAVLSGVTVTNCQSAFSISKGLIRDCRAKDIGGGRNSNGGGYYVEGGRVENCEAINVRETFLSPTVNTFCSGAGLNISGGVVSNFLCRGCIIRPAENGRNARGGSVYAEGGTLIDATIEDSCRDADRGHDYFGANIYGSNCTLVRCRFVGMRTGAGIGTRLSNVKATSCLFADNVLSKAYTNFYATGCALVNCTIASNLNENVSVYLNNCAVTNTIVTANGSGDEILNGGTYSHCCSDMLDDGVDGNIVADPLFKAVERGDFSLLKSSPCVNGGVRQDWMTGEMDIVGNPRVLGGAPDIGCYEVKQVGLELLIQ